MFYILRYIMDVHSLKMTRRGSKLVGVVTFQLQLMYGDIVHFVGVVLHNY
jgi:hypothetical protein